MATELTVKCPKCKAKIALTEALAGPVLEAAREEFEKEKNAVIRAAEHRAGEQADKAARAEAKDVIAKQNNDAAELKERLGVQEQKLKVAQQREADFTKAQRALDDDKREMQLTIETQIEAGLLAVRAQASAEVEKNLGSKVAEKELTITSMRMEIDSLARKAEQGSQQVQGEAFELALEKALGEAFPGDHIEPVPKGICGGDIFQHVKSPTLHPCGTILWELKNTKAWVDAWLPKLREDQRASQADVCVLVSTVLPKGAGPFALIRGVWVVLPQVAVAFALMLRQGLMEVETARGSAQNQETKMELVYQYLTGKPFKLRVQAIVEAFTTMNKDLATEKTVISKNWAKRETQIARVLHNTVGLYGDLQGIAGEDALVIKELEFDEKV